MAGCLEPFEDIDGADGEAYSISYADVEVNGYFCAVDPQFGGWLDLASHFVLIVDICTGEFE